MAGRAFADDVPPLAVADEAEPHAQVLEHLA
jgi:hypothetical protein